MLRAAINAAVAVAALSIVLTFAVAEASATDDVVICIEYETNFDDNEMGDYYASPAPENYDAIRPQVRVWDNDSSTQIYNAYTNAGGCTPTLNLNEAHDFQIKVYAASLLSDSNEIRVYDNADNPVQHSQILQLHWNPLRDDTYTMTYQYNATYRVSNVLAAAGWAVDRRPAGLSNLDINYFTDPCPDTDPENSCWQENGGNHRIMLHQAGRGRKFTIIHETGHEISFQKNDNDGSVDNCSYEGLGECWDGRDCDSCHCNKCIEYQSCAAWEGFADFYMVAAWNDEDDPANDCDYSEGGDSCEDGGDWIEEGSCCTNCTGKGTESDWVHFWWDLYQDSGYSMDDIAQLYNLADPEDWGDPEYVYPSFRWSAMSLGKNLSIWDTWADYNGVNH